MGDGLQFSNLFDSQDNFPSGNSIIMLIVDIILYMILALYFDAVVPGEYGQRKVPYFCFLPSFWKGLFARTPVDAVHLHEHPHAMADLEESEDIEPVAAELSAKKAIRYLSF